MTNTKSETQSTDDAMTDGDKQSPRKIVQVATICGSNGYMIHALCDDGSLFEYRREHQGDKFDDWHPLPPIPQDEVK